MFLTLLPYLTVAANLVRAFRRRAVVSAASESTRSFGFTNTLIASIVISQDMVGDTVYLMLEGSAGVYRGERDFPPASRQCFRRPQCLAIRPS